MIDDAVDVWEMWFSHTESQLSLNVEFFNTLITRLHQPVTQSLAGFSLLVDGDRTKTNRPRMPFNTAFSSAQFKQIPHVRFPKLISTTTAPLNLLENLFFCFPNPPKCALKQQQGLKEEDPLNNFSCFVISWRTREHPSPTRPKK